MDESFKQKIEAIVGKASSDNRGYQFGISSFFPERLVHCEWYDKSHHVELHLKGQTPSPDIRSLADYLKEHLPSDDRTEIVDRSSISYFSYMLKGPAIDGSDAETMGAAFNTLLNIVTPVVNEYIDSLRETAAIAKSLSDYYNLIKKNEPYHINVIDELHANENAHSRILISLLNYPKENRFPILESFLDMLRGWKESGLTVGKPSIKFNSENIDGLIEKAHEYAVIIENKIHWAADQDAQLERYVDTVLGHGIPASNIWVVYLTSDGNKVAADYSNTERVKRLIADRFITMNYRNDILPWLKETVLPECTIREEWLVTALKQYIDHLEGMFHLRTSQMGIQLQMEQKLYDELGLMRSSGLQRTYRELTRREEDFAVLKNVISNKKASIEEPVIKEFEELTQAYFSKQYHDENCEFINMIQQNGYYQIRPFGNFPNAHLELIPLWPSSLFSSKDLTIVLHVEIWSSCNKKATNAVIDRLKTDEDLMRLNNKYNFKIKTPTFFSFTSHMSKPFAEMTYSERENTLTALYDEACKVIPIVRKYLVSGE